MQIWLIHRLGKTICPEVPITIMATMAVIITGIKLEEGKTYCMGRSIIGSASSLWLQAVGMCQQYEGFSVYLMSLTYTLTVSLKCCLYTFVNEITAWEFLLRSSMDFGSVKSIDDAYNVTVV